MYISYTPAPQPSVFMVSFTYLPLTFDFVSYTDDEEEGDWCSARLGTHLVMVMFIVNLLGSVLVLLRLIHSLR